MSRVSSLDRRKPQWPKKQRVIDYLEVFMDPDKERQRVVRQLRAGELPGIKEGSTWFVWVLPDGSPAWGYQSNQPVEKKQQIKIGDIANTGNPIADAVLLKMSIEKGVEIR